VINKITLNENKKAFKLFSCPPCAISKTNFDSKYPINSSLSISVTEICFTSFVILIYKYKNKVSKD